MKSKRTGLASRQTRYRRACWWLSLGVPVVPIKPRSKQLVAGYGPRKAHITDSRLAATFFLKTDANLGVVLGGKPGLIVADWDRLEDYDRWRNSTGREVATLAERTGRGYHYFFFGKGLSSAVGDGCEFKADGVCTVSPSIHPSGAVYQIVNNVPILDIDDETARLLFPFLSDTRQRDRWVRTSSLDARSAHRVGEGSSMSDGVVARIKTTRSIAAEMQAAGIALRPGGAKALVGLCPFHDDHNPSLWANPESGLWGCNRPDCPAAGVHDVINFRAIWKGISNSAAIKQMAREFL